MNLVMIAMGLWLVPALGEDPHRQVTGWAVAVVLGGSAQLAVQAPAVTRLGFRVRPGWPFRHEGVRRVMRQMLPAVLGLSVVQINILVNQHLASRLQAGSISWLYYGNRLMQLPLGVFGVAIATAVFPVLAARSAGRQSADFQGHLGFALRLALILTLPAAVGLMMLAEPINRLLFMWGRFTPADAAAAARATAALSMGIWVLAFGKILAPAFYAMEDAKTPVKVAVSMVALNLALSLSLMGPLAYLGLALSVALTAAVNGGALLWLMRRKLAAQGLDPGMGLLDTAMKGALASLVMALVLDRWLALLNGWEGRLSRPLLALAVAVAVGAGALIYLGTARWMGLDLVAMWRGARVQRGRES